MTKERFAEAVEFVKRARRPIIVAGDNVHSGLIVHVAITLNAATGRHIDTTRHGLVPPDNYYVMDAGELLLHNELTGVTF